MASEEQKGQDALCKLLLEEALMRVAAEQGVQVDRVEWRDLAPDHAGPPSFEEASGKEMKVWSGKQWHYLNLTTEEFQGCLSEGNMEHRIERKMLAFLKEHYLPVWDA